MAAKSLTTSSSTNEWRIHWKQRSTQVEKLCPELVDSLKLCRDEADNVIFPIEEYNLGSIMLVESLEFLNVAFKYVR